MLVGLLGDQKPALMGFLVHNVCVCVSVCVCVCLSVCVCVCVNIYMGLLGDHEPALMEFLVHHTVFRNVTRSSVQVSSKRQAEVIGYTLNEVHMGSREWEEGESHREPRI